MQAVGYLVAVFSAAVLSWSQSPSSVAIPTMTELTSIITPTEKDELKDEEERMFAGQLQKVLYTLLPDAMLALLKQDQYKTLTARVSTRYTIYSTYIPVSSAYQAAGYT